MASNKVGIVVCDFGLATMVPEGVKYVPHTVGTPNYMAPEIVLEKGACFASDIFSLGVTLFHCLTGRPPFNGKNVSGTYRRIMEGSYRWKTAEKANISSTLRHMIDDMMDTNPNKRLTPSQVLAQLR